MRGPYSNNKQTVRVVQWDNVREEEKMCMSVVYSVRNHYPRLERATPY
jgi:hypothetical protein